MTSRHHRYICAGAALWMSAACGGAQPAPRVASGPADGSAASPATERGRPAAPVAANGTAAGPASPPAPSAPFVLEARLRASRIQNGRPITFDELHSGDTVMDGDRLQFSVRTSKDAYLYLAFCSNYAEDPRYHGLSIFPDSGSIRMRANETMTVPTATGGIALDDKPGRETLYLILSQAELSHADAGLADVIDAARRGHDAIDCGAPLHAPVAAPTRKSSLDRKSGSNKSRSPTSSPEPERPTAHPADPDAGKPPVGIERGGQIVLADPAQPGDAADPDGIVILRYELKHEHASAAGTASLR